MSWFSILPAQLTVVETWIVRFFLLLGFLTISPWLLFLVNDVILYILRAAFYEIPYLGGRAQGKRRSRAPTLAERPNGRKRAFSISGASGVDGADDGSRGVRRRSIDCRQEGSDGSVSVHG